MHDPSIRNPAYHSLTDQQFFEIDELCDRFDEELVSGGGPRIETFLAEAPEAARDGLLAELLTIEIEHRTSHGEDVSADEYLSRFPDDAELIEKAFDFARESDVPTGPIGQFDEPTVSIAHADSEVSTVDTTCESRRAEDATTFEPQPFGRYTLLRLLGRGGMGSVYLAHDSELDRKVAIKFPEFDDRPDVAAAAIERFRREARAMATVHHPNICPIFDVGKHDGRHYLTMAFIDGQILSEAVGSLSQAEIVRLVMTTSRALHAAHQAGVVHRDLKPSNVMLDKRGEPIVTDFGLASRAALLDSGLTHSGLIIGSPAYMAPEQVDAAHDKVGPRTDVYALGVILYQLLTGRRPFDGTGLSVLGKIAAGESPEPPSQIAAVSPALEVICLKAMAHQIEDRFQSAEALAEVLDDYLKTGNAAAVEVRTSRRRITLTVGGILILAVSSLLIAMVAWPGTNTQPGSESQTGADTQTGSESVTGADTQTGSESVTDSSEGRLKLIPASIGGDADVAIVFLEGDRRIHARGSHGVEVHVIVKGGEQIIEHAKRMNYNFLKRNTLLDPYFAHGWYRNSDTAWSDFRAIHFRSDIDSDDPIWGVNTNRKDSLVGPVIIVTGPEADNPYFEANNDQIQPTGLGTWIKLRTNDHEDVRGVADGSIYLSDRGWLELCWMGDKESLLNSCKTYYLPSGTSLQDIGLRPGTSHAKALFPEAQIIVATHSPFVISSVNDGFIHVFRAKANGEVVVDAPHECSQGDSWIDAVEDVLGVSEWYDPETEQFLSQFRTARDSVLTGGSDIDALQELATTIGERSESLANLMGREMRQVVRFREQRASHEKATASAEA